MRFLRGVAGALLWLLASVVGLLGVVLCVTIILLPLGIPLFRLTRKLFGEAVRLMMPRALAHPVKESRRKGRQVTPDPPDVSGTTKKLRKKARKTNKKLKKKVGA